MFNLKHIKNLLPRVLKKNYTYILFIIAHRKYITHKL